MMSNEELLIDRISSSMRTEVSDVQPPADLLQRLRAGRGSGRRPSVVSR
jgi:hypothetical protein